METFKAIFWSLYALVKSFGGLAGSIALWFLFVPEHNGWFHENLSWVNTDWLFWGKIWFWCYVDIIAIACLTLLGIKAIKG